VFHRTTRLFLRPAWPEDWEAVLGGIADEGVVRNLARAPWPYGPGEHDGEPEIGYWIARPYWGQGYATEAAGGVLEVARLLGHGRVSAGHFVDNPASGRVLRKLGFVPTGVTRPRMSCARGQEVMAHEYALDLDAGAAPQMRAA
jgi:RimJ/RimL family protein N-acetyltransferase